MKRLVVVLSFLALAAPAWAQTDKPPAKEAEKKEPPAKMAASKKPNPKRQEDARHCLERATNTEIIKCAEEYL